MDSLVVPHHQIPWTDLSEESVGSHWRLSEEREKALERTDLRIAILRKNWSARAHTNRT